ncbi:MAG: PhoH family protein, partial [Aquificaceae bacterium]|nr:PhoH family protein [Aquificaceae bacterium]
MTEKVEEKLDLGSFDEKFYAIVGRGDENLKYFSQLFEVKISARGTEILIRGEEDKVRVVQDFLSEIIRELRSTTLTSQEVRERAKNYLQAKTLPESFREEVILVTHRKKAIVPKTHTQSVYVDAIRNNDVVFGIGPAGTGKTYLAMAMALACLLYTS